MKPPRLATRWLRLCLDTALREDILKDLEHHFEQQRRIHGPARARVWYWRQAAMATLATVTAWKDRAPSAAAWKRKSSFEPGRLLHGLDGAVRSWRNDKVVAFATIITLALGIGSVTGVYSVLHATVLRPLPYPEPDRLVFIWSIHNRDDSRGVLSGRSFHELGQDENVFRQLAQMKGHVDDVLQTDEGAVAVRRRSVSYNFLRTYGVTPVLGRDFRAEDRRLLPPETIRDPNARWPTMPVVIAHELWANQFGGDPDVLGRILRVGGRQWEVIGVMPEGFRTYLPAGFDSSPADLWYLSPWDERLFPRTVRFVSTVGRLAPGVTVAGAQAAVDMMSQRIRDTEADMREADLHFQVVPLHGEVFMGTSRILVLSLSAVILMLLIACTSAANLLLARGTTRIREMAVRTAFGASRRRLAQRVLAETGVLALAGGGVGLMVASLSTTALVALAPPDIPRLDEVELNPSVLLFSFAVTIGTALLAGLLPAVRASRVSPSRALSNRTIERGAELGGLRWRNGFVVTQLGTSVVLVVATALLARSVLQLQRIELGFEPQRALAGELRLTSTHHPGVDARIAFYRQVVERLRAVPGITAAAVVSGVPLGGLDSIEVTPVGSVDAFDAVYRVTTPGLVDTFGLSLVEGRDLTWSDLARTDHLMTLVDASFAERAWPGASAIGRRFAIEVLRLSDDRDVWEGYDEAEVVGVTADMRGRDPRESDPPTFFVSHRLRATSGQKIVLRAESEPLALTEPLRSTIADLDPTIPVARVWLIEDSVAEATRSVRFVATLFSALGVVGLVLAAIGLYSVMAYTVASRRAEFGIRFALGATGRVIGGLVLGQAFRLTALGVASGTLAAMGLARFIEAQLFGVSAKDPGTYAGVAVTLCLVAGGAALLPALRAWRDDPIASLRED